METIDQGETSMKPEVLTKRGAAITTHEEENVRARTDELYEVRDRIDGHAEQTAFTQKAKSHEATIEEPSEPLPQIAITNNRWRR
jgi:glycerol kinase